MARHACRPRQAAADSARHLRHRPPRPLPRPPPIDAPHAPPRRYNPDLVPGCTIVVGTEQGLYARVERLAEPLLRLRATRDDGEVLETELPLLAEALAEVGGQAMILRVLAMMGH